MGKEKRGENLPGKRCRASGLLLPHALLFSPVLPLTSNKDQPAHYFFIMMRRRREKQANKAGGICYIQN